MQPASGFTHDFWRVEGEEVPTHFGHTTVESFVYLTIKAIFNLLRENPSLDLRDMDHITFHQPSGYMAMKTMKTIASLSRDPFKIENLVQDENIRKRMTFGIDEGFINERIKPYLKPVFHTGNTYAASALLGTAYILDGAKPDIGRKDDYTVTRPGDNILTVSYGSWAHSIATWLKVQDGIYEKVGRVPTLQTFFNRMREIEFSDYEKRVYGSAMEKLRATIETGREIRFPRLIAELENFRDGFYEVAKCDGCHRVIFPVPALGKCFDDNHPTDLRIIRLPKTATVRTWGKIPLKEYENTRRKGLEAELFYRDGEEDIQIPLVDIIGEPQIGMQVKAVPRVFIREKHGGPISYGIAYAIPPELQAQTKSEKVSPSAIKSKQETGIAVTASQKQ
jgi:uncharacterized OB-fold protein